MNTGVDNIEVDSETGDLWFGCQPLFWAIMDIQEILGWAHRSQVDFLSYLPHFYYLSETVYD